MYLQAPFNNSILHEVTPDLWISKLSNEYFVLFEIEAHLKKL